MRLNFLSLKMLQGVLHCATIAMKKAQLLKKAGGVHALENTGTGPMIMMGHRSGSQDNVKIIDYVTRKDIREHGGPVIRNRHDAAPAAGE